MHHVLSAHLPHAKGSDSEDVATEFMHATFNLLRDLIGNIESSGT